MLSFLFYHLAAYLPHIYSHDILVVDPSKSFKQPPGQVEIVFAVLRVGSFEATLIEQQDKLHFRWGDEGGRLFAGCQEFKGFAGNSRIIGFKEIL